MDSARAKLADWIPAGEADNNSYARGLEVVLNYLDHEVDYDTIMGDSGQAFILQGEENSTNLHDGAVDVGWWPLEPVGITIRLDFLEQVVGRELREVMPRDADGGYGAYSEDPAAFYADALEPAVRKSLASGMPCLTQHGTWFIVTGADEGEPPITGAWACGPEQKIVRLSDGYPYNLVMPGESVPRIDRKAADIEALRYAVALHQDKVLGPDAEAGVYGAPRAEGAKYGEHWRTGVRSYAAWVDALNDMENLGQARWHSNVVYQLGINRRSAVPYLRAMAARHEVDVAGHLARAAEMYEDVLQTLGRADTSEDAMSSAEGRSFLVALIEEIAEVERRAVTELGNAANAIN
ncbi:MAG: hypothetical protein ABGY41_15305 [Candidatus Poribacteria bacterium]